MINTDSEDGQTVRQLIPVSTFSNTSFESLCSQVTVEQKESGEFLFKRNDKNDDLIFLIKGSICLQANELLVETIKAGSDSSRFALAHQIPRKIDGYTKTAVRFVRINTDIINSLSNKIDSTYKGEDNYMVDEQEDEQEDDWMTTLLKSPIFQALPPSNLQQIIIGLEEVEYKKNEIIIRQGEEGDFYYIIKHGHCLLSRKPTPNAKEIKLAQMHKQDTFGEDSLLSGEPRNVTITALTDVSLLRLSKEKFISLIKIPALRFIDYPQIEEELEKGTVLLDVRTPDEFKMHNLPNSINAPFITLRMQLKTFDKKKRIIVICANGKTSEAAAFLLLRHDFTALILENGMENVPAPLENTPELIAAEGNLSANSYTAEKAQNIGFDDQAGSIKPKQESQVHELNVLRLENQQLQLTIESLVAEKKELEKKYLILFKHTEKIKSILDKERAQNKSKN